MFQAAIKSTADRGQLTGKDTCQFVHVSTPAPHSMTKATVAALLPVDIARMDDSQLVEAIRASDLTLLSNENFGRLEFQDRCTLERLVYLARRCCRNLGY